MSSGYCAFVAMATALARIAIARFGQLSIRPQRALCVKAPEDAGADLLRVGIWFGLEEHVFSAQRRAEIRTIRIQIVKFSHFGLLRKSTGRLGGGETGRNLPPVSPSPRRPVAAILPPAESRV